MIIALDIWGKIKYIIFKNWQEENIVLLKIYGRKLGNVGQGIHQENK